MINWHAVDKKNSTKNNTVFTKKLKSNMSLEVMPLINFIYFYHLDSLLPSCGFTPLTTAIHEVLLLRRPAQHPQGVSKRR